MQISLLPSLMFRHHTGCNEDDAILFFHLEAGSQICLTFFPTLPVSGNIKKATYSNYQIAAVTFSLNITNST